MARRKRQHRRTFPTWLISPLVWLAMFPAWWWVRRQERRILADGRPLDELELRDAQEAGVTRPEAIRLLILPVIPTPGGAWLRGLARLVNFPIDPPLGMALGHGIYLERAIAGGRATFVHECVHVAQYERLGGMWPFLKHYLAECVRDGYHGSAMEAEANQLAQRVCQTGA